MAAYKPTSWGRTRRPKALSDNHAVPSKETAVAVTILATSGLLADDLDSADDGKNGYVTRTRDICMSTSPAPVPTRSIYMVTTMLLVSGLLFLSRMVTVLVL